MSFKPCTPFGTFAPIYIERGLWPRPCKYPGVDSKTGKKFGKACRKKGWQVPDPDLPDGTMDIWLKRYPHYNIALLMGTKLEDGTHLGALDIDRNEYAPIGKALLGNPPCGRIGKKGAVYFVRLTPELFQRFVKKDRYYPTKFTVAGEHNRQWGQVAECLFHKLICVIPPSIHPDTEQEYQWIGTPLHDIDFTKLPLIGE